MVDFRRMIPVLAVIAFLLGSAVTASAQTPFQCFANGGVSTPARSEDITALVGDLVLNCTGGTPTAAGAIVPAVNIQIFLNTGLTSRLMSTSGTLWSEALLILDDPQPQNQFGCFGGATSLRTPGTTLPAGVCENIGNGFGTTPATSVGVNNKNVFQGQQTATNSVTFIGIPIDPPGTTGSRVVRITNVRGNANALGVAGSNATPTPIVETISPTPPQFLPVSNPSQTVAFIQRGMTFGLFTSLGGTTDGTSRTLQQCDNTRASNSTNFNNRVAVLRYTENFATAFRKRFVGDCDPATSGPCTANISSALGNTGGLQNDLRVGTYNTESGFVNPSLTLPTQQSGITQTAGGAATPGLADWGTRLKAVFNNIPNGVNIWVDINATPTVATIQDRAVLTSPETGAFQAVAAATAGSSTPTGGTTVGAVAQLTVTNGTAVAVWEVIQSDPNTFAALSFGYYASFTASPGTNSPALATATVNGSYAPTSTVTVAAAANVPRFADTSTASNIFTVVPCLTTLLFPYMTNQVGFDTGFAISATATDPFGTSPQSGNCTLNWYGKAFTGATPFPAAGGVVGSGTTEVGLVSGVLNNVTGGFSGYMIAVCRFQYAHGFAFVSDLGARNLAMGYLALVIPDPSVSGRLATPAVCGGGGSIASPALANGCVSSGENLSN